MTAPLPLLMLTCLLAVGCVRAPTVTAPITTVIVEPPPAKAAPPGGCVRANPTCTYQALALEFGRLTELPAYCEARLTAGGEAISGRAKVDGIARLSGPASWDIVADIEALARTTMRTCYEEGLRVDPTLTGVMELEFQVEETRSCVSEIVVTDSSIADEITHDCVVNALMGYPLPVPGSRMSTRIVFKPTVATEQK